MRLGNLATALIVALVLALLVGSPAKAEIPRGDGPFDAMTPTQEWQTLESEQYDWYVFHFTTLVVWRIERAATRLSPNNPRQWRTFIRND